MVTRISPPAKLTLSPTGSRPKVSCAKTELQGTKASAEKNKTKPSKNPNRTFVFLLSLNKIISWTYIYLVDNPRNFSKQSETSGCETSRKGEIAAQPVSVLEDIVTA